MAAILSNLKQIDIINRIEKGILKINKNIEGEYYGTI